MLARLARHRTALLVTVGLIAYLALSFRRLSFPGLNYDEVLFANGALGGIDGTYIHRTFLGIPIFLMDYIGGLKAWLYAPVFAISGVTVASIRVPMILMSAAALLLFHSLARRHAGPRAAVFAFFLLLTNAAYLWGAKVDMGPVVPATLLEVLAAYALLEDRPALFAAACVLGLFHKLAFVFWLFGFLIAALLFLPRLRRTAIAGAAASAAYLAWWSWYLGGRPTESAMGIGTRLSFLGGQLADLVDGSSVYRFVGLPHPWILHAGLFSLAIVLAGLYRLRGRHSLLSLLCVQLLLSFALLFVVKSAGMYWHFYGLLPWIYLGVAIALTALGRYGVVLFAILLAGNVYGQLRSAAAVDEKPGNAHFTMAIYPLIDWCREQPRLCVATQWGIHTQVEAFTWKDKAPRPFTWHGEADPRYLYVNYYELAGVNHADEPAAFYRAAESAGFEAKLVKQIFEGEQPMFAVYELWKATSSSSPGSPR